MHLRLLPVFLLALASAAQSAELIKVQPGGIVVQPATRPTTQPKKEATVTPEAQPVLAQLDKAYRDLKSLELSGSIQLAVVEDQTPRKHETKFHSAFAAPNQFLYEAGEQPRIGSTGKKVYGYSLRRNVYFEADAPKERPMVRDLPVDVQAILGKQDPSLALAVSKDAAAELREFAKEIGRLPDQDLDGKKHAALGLKMAGDMGQVTLLIDPATGLVRRTVMDYTPVLRKAGRDDIERATFTIDYAAIKPNAALGEQVFAWTPPPGARSITMAAVAGADDDEEGPGGGPGTSALVGKPAPDFALANLDGEQVSLADLKGSVILLDFWATWCGPCVMALPHIDKLQQELKADGLKAFAVNQREAKDRVAGFIKEKNLGIPVLLDADGAVGKAYGVRGIPTTVIIGKDGLVKKVLVGFDPDGEDELKAFISEQLKAEEK